jgi:predicted patatin/cPLA2 family phospholipase
MSLDQKVSFDRDAWPSVVELISARKEALDAGSELCDGFKLGLAVEGGGMKGVVSGAMLIALDDLGLRDVFDGYYGTSSGSMNLAYFLSGRRWDALTMYYDILGQSRFVSPARALARRGPVMDMGLLYDEIMEHVLPLDYDAVLAASPSLHVGVSSLDDLAGVVKTDFSGRDELKAFLQAGAWVPILAGGAAEIDGMRYLDGGVFFPHPMYAAQDSGCTHVLTLRTRYDSLGGGRSMVWHYYLRAYLNRLEQGAGDCYMAGIRRYADDRRRMTRGDLVLGDSLVFQLTVREGGHEVGRLTGDRAALLDGASAGYLAVMDQLGDGVPAESVHLNFS